MLLQVNSAKSSLTPAVRASKPLKGDFESFQKALEVYKHNVGTGDREETLKTHLASVLRAASGGRVEPWGAVDLVVARQSKGSITDPIVLVEHKASTNAAEMIRHDDVNRKAMHEAILYYMRARKDNVTTIRHVIIATEIEMYVFHASTFERAFFADGAFRKQFDDW